MSSAKYNRTPHLPWSKGKGNDDKVAKSVNSLLGRPIVISEKIDGENCSWEADGCFARTHAHPPTHPSFDIIKAMHADKKHLIHHNHQYFGEAAFAKHSIYYDALPGYFLLFGIRNIDIYQSLWAPWSEVAKRALKLEIPTVPVLWSGVANSARELENITTELAAMPSACGGEREGVVVRIADGFDDENFSQCVMKFVRANHIPVGDDHWKHKEIIKNGLKK